MYQQTTVEKIAQKAAELEMVFSAIPDAMVFTNTGDEIILVNSAFSKLFGYSKEDIEGKHASALYSNPEAYEQRMHRYSRTGKDEALEPVLESFRHQDGSMFFKVTDRSRVKDARGQLVGILDIIRDAPVVIQKNRFRTFFDSAPIGIAIIRQDGLITYANEETERLFGYDQGEMLSGTIEMLLPERYRTSHVQLRAQYGENPHYRPMGIGLELAGQHKHGHEFPVEVSLNAVEIDGETMSICFIVDVSKQKQVEEALRKSEELLRSTIHFIHG